MHLNPYIFEFIGTLVLVLFGDGVCAACSLNKSKAKGGGWVVIALAWGLAVMMGVLVAGPVSGAHLNPAVTLGLAIAGKFAWGQVLGYIVAQMLGGFVGALLVYVFYKDHYKATSDEPDTMLGTFCTMPAIWNPWRNFLSELIATTLLVFIILHRRHRRLAGHLPDHGPGHVPGRNHRLRDESGARPQPALRPRHPAHPRQA